MISAQATARESEGMRLRSKGGDMTMRTSGAKGHDVSRALHASDGDINRGESGLVDGQASNFRGRSANKKSRSWRPCSRRIAVVVSC